jgi:quinol monooxygenase YgiN
MTGTLERRSALMGMTALGVALLAGPSRRAAAAPPSAPSNPNGVSFVVHITSRPDTRARLRAMVFEVIDAMSSEPDFLNTFINEDMQDPDVLVIYETWACSREEFLSRHLSKPYRAAFEQALPSLQGKPRTLEFLKPVRAYPLRTV